MYFEAYTDIQLKESFDFIEQFISQNVENWDTTPQTNEIEQSFSRELQSMETLPFALLLVHSGYIPEFYLPDSSQETLYSKLIESLVCEWAKRIGFSQSYLQTQKSNKEDITIISENNIIVCDAKSFRLGRSQAAPNVKDTIKKQAYITWLTQHNNMNQVGGLVTFPSLHDWQKGSEAYSYFTEGEPPIMLLFYEQMAYMLLNNINASDIIAFLENYPTHYPSASKNKEVYWEKIKNILFANGNYDEFIIESSTIIQKMVNHTLSRLNNEISACRSRIQQETDTLSFDQLKELVVQVRTNLECGNYHRQMENIKKFRPH